LAGEEREPGRERGEDPAAATAGERSHPRLRRAPFGYRRADVDAALAARDAELAELRQDVAALWLAFAQHDRLLRDAPGAAEAAAAAQPQSGTATGGTVPEADPEQAAARAAAIGAQLSELDHVLSAIEEATRTLERTYASETGEPGGDDPSAAADAGTASGEGTDEPRP
jgi:hypothetical protein